MLDCLPSLYMLKLLDLPMTSMCPVYNTDGLGCSLIGNRRTSKSTVNCQMRAPCLAPLLPKPLSKASTVPCSCSKTLGSLCTARLHNRAT